MSKPVVSVIIPVFDRSAVLDRSVGSALRQSGLDVEVIAVDDGSRDDSVAVLEALAARYPKKSLVIVQQSENVGQAAARNAGLALARGKYIAFLDSDDAFEAEDTLALWVADANRTGAEIVVARSEQVLEDGSRAATAVWHISDTPAAVSNTPVLVSVRNFWQCLYRKTYLDARNIAFSTQLRQREDRLFMLQAFYAADRIFFFNRITHLRYRDQDNATMKGRSIEQLEMFIQHVDELAETVRIMRANRRSNLDFEMINAFQYYRSCTSYWRPTVLACYREGRRDVVKRLAEGLSKLAQGLPDFASHPRFAGPQGARIDMVRLVLKHEKLWAFRLLVNHKGLNAQQLAGLAGPHKAVVERYLVATGRAGPAA